MKKGGFTKFQFILLFFLISLSSNVYGKSIFEIHHVYPYIRNINIDGYTKFVRGEHDYPPFVWVADNVEMDISDLKLVTFEPDKIGPTKKNFIKIEHKITFAFNPKGTKKLSNLTKKITLEYSQLIGYRIAILVDGNLLTVPAIFSEISNGVAVFTSTLPQKEVETMVKKINEGISQNKF